MKKITTAVFCMLLAIIYSQPGSAQKTALIPEPVSLLMGKGMFVLPKVFAINTANNAEVKKIALQLGKIITVKTGSSVQYTVKSGSPAKSISLLLVPGKSIAKEGYKMSVTSTSVTITANEPSGIFYGVQTLLQLLPKEIENAEASKNQSWSIPAVTIEDHPRFGWRGLMLDVSRHFFTKQEVKDFIDQMVKYKFNVLHWHISDDQGWRIEIKSLPKLTEVGAWRVAKTGTFGTFSSPTADEPRTYGGFYTQDDIKEVVQYAKDRYVNILPEIDVPGHSMAAIAAYPELTCTAAPAGTYVVNSGERLMVWPPGGHFYGLFDNALCPANEKVYEFLDKVFTEVAQLFPFEYIHMGGDETARNFWEKSDAVKGLMQKENLKNLDEVQSYFVKRMEKIVSSKGKKMIGWDEILDGGLPPNAAVMSWRGIRGGIEAAKQGHEVVMSPTDFVYLDYMQGDAIMEPPVYASLRLKKAYQFEPVPDGVDPKLIKGGQGNIWTEQIYNTRHLEYMVWPRAFALSEALWSPKEKRNWDGFIPRVENHFQRLDAAGIKYAPSIYDPAFEVAKDTVQIQITLTTEANNLDIHYSFDNSFPDQFYPKYTSPVTAPKDAVTMKVITYRDNKPIGRLVVMPVAELKRRAAR
ncbi:MAG: family 20 glycosylhydrolase [Chitinophagaceae bacterium]